MSQGKATKAAMDSGYFGFRSERTGGDERIHLLGEMDLSVIGSVDREIRRAEAGDAARIVLDLDELEFLDASGVRLLLHLSARSKSNGGRLCLTKARSRQVQRVIELTGAGDVLPFID
jgi:stage II sporulation protein AA (anti-sigma F factor antagonist)